MLKTILLSLFCFTFLFSLTPLQAYDKIGKNSRGYYYPNYYKQDHRRNRDPNFVKYYYIYDHDYYPAYSYTNPGAFRYVYKPYYYHNDNGEIWSYWSY